MESVEAAQKAFSNSKNKIIAGDAVTIELVENDPTSKKRDNASTPIEIPSPKVLFFLEYAK